MSDDSSEDLGHSAHSTFPLSSEEQETGGHPEELGLEMGGEDPTENLDTLDEKLKNRVMLPPEELQSP